MLTKGVSGAMRPTLTPREAISAATARPAGPAPTTSTSTVASFASGSRTSTMGAWSLKIFLC